MPNTPADTDVRLSVQATTPFPAESTALIDGPFFAWVNQLTIFAGTPTVNEPGRVSGKCIQIAEIVDDFERDDTLTDNNGDYLNGRKFSPQAVALCKLLTSSAKFRQALLTVKYQCDNPHNRPPSERLELIAEAAAEALAFMETVEVEW